MATDRNVAEGSKWCRACGGPTTPPVGGYTTCPNRASGGLQKSPRDFCENLGPATRDYCEHCGEPVRRGGPCVACRKPPLPR
jgi:hypothetical protein